MELVGKTGFLLRPNIEKTPMECAGTPVIYCGLRELLF